MGRSSLIFSADSDLSGTLDGCLTDTCGFNVRSCSDSELARDALTNDPGLLMFVDVRAEWVTEQTEELLSRLSREPADPFNLIVVSDGYYPRHLAAAVDRVAVTRLDDPINAGQVKVSVAGLNGGRSLAPSYAAQADDIRFVTYAQNLFPVIDRLLRVAAHNVVVLIVGETGTGKTTLARLVHQISPRCDKPFHNVACGALPKDLIESELFGHVRGAFTGADRSKIGRFEAAGNGTLLLDEIDVLGPNEQAKLLRVIETGEYELVGSTETRVSKARLIVASNVELETMIEKMEFRADLYYRLNVVEFRLPPLRERPSDIVPMALEFMDDCCREHDIEVQRVHCDFLAALKRYHWPGNIRELKNQVQRAVLFCDDGDLTAESLSPTVLESSESPKMSGSVPAASSLAERVARGEREILEAALRENDYHRTRTADALGMSRVGLYKKMCKYGMIVPKSKANKA